METWDMIRWRGAVASAIRGKRGQAFLRELLVALEAMPDKRLITEDLVCEGEVCALGALGRARKLEMSRIDPEDYDGIADAFDIAPALVREIEWENDECGSSRETPEERWIRVRAWVRSRLRVEVESDA